MGELLTTLSLLVAACALLPEEQKIDLLIRTTRFEIGMFLVGFIVFFFVVVLGPLLNYHGLGFGVYVWGLDSKFLYFLLSLALLGWFIVKVFFTTKICLLINTKPIDLLKEKTKFLLSKHEYPKVYFLLKKYTEQIKNTLDLVDSDNVTVEKYRKNLFYVYLDFLFKSEAFISWLVENDPTLAIEYYLYYLGPEYDYSTTFHKVIILNKNSFLYEEMRFLNSVYSREM